MLRSATSALKILLRAVGAEACEFRCPRPAAEGGPLGVTRVPRCLRWAGEAEADEPREIRAAARSASQALFLVMPQQGTPGFQWRSARRWLARPGAPAAVLVFRVVRADIASGGGQQAGLRVDEQDPAPAGVVQRWRSGLSRHRALNWGLRMPLACWRPSMTACPAGRIYLSSTSLSGMYFGGPRTWGLTESVPGAHDDGRTAKNPLGAANHCGRDGLVAALLPPSIALHDQIGDVKNWSSATSLHWSRPA
jgi:hypothetical protein